MMTSLAAPALTRPASAEYPANVANYIDLVPAGDLIAILSDQADTLTLLVAHLSDAEALVHHAPYTWSIKEVLGHLADCERVFGYRLMRVARNDTTPLPGFDENAYMENVQFDPVPLPELLEELLLARRSHSLMLRHLASEAWCRIGNVNGHPMSARAIACVLAGHMQHHLNILANRLS
jgi:hypothetical protein